MNIFTEHEPSWKDQGYFFQPIVWIRLVFCGFACLQAHDLLTFITKQGLEGRQISTSVINLVKQI